MLSDKQQKIIYDIICEDVHGKEFYTNEMFEKLLSKVEEIYTSLDLDTNLSDQEKIDRVDNYFVNNVQVRKDYFMAFNEMIPEIPESELKYRTAYGALVENQAMCAGFTEASRMLLELSGLKTKTLLSKLPGHNKQLLHYVTAIKYDRGSGRDYYIMDPERERSCMEKGFDFRRYLMEMTYILPEENFFKNKVGQSGVGPKADDYLQQVKPRHVISKNKVDELFSEGEPVSND